MPVASVPSKTGGNYHNNSSPFFSNRKSRASFFQKPSNSTRVLGHTPLPSIQSKLLLEEDAAKTPSLKSVLETLAGQSLQLDDNGGLSIGEGPANGGSSAIRAYIQRAIDASKTFRIKTGTLAVDKEGIEEKNGAIQITVDYKHFGKGNWTPEELLSQKIVSAVIQHAPSSAMGPTPDKNTGEDPLPPISTDQIINLPLTDTEQRIKQRHIKAYTEQQLQHLNAGQRRLIYNLGWTGKGVPLTEMIRGVEMNVPFTFRQEIKDGRVFAEICDPKGFPADADKLDTGAFIAMVGKHKRNITFLPGAKEETAKPVNFPKTNTSCTKEERADSSNSCCTPEMLTELRQHLATSRAYLKRARQRLEGDQPIDCKLRRHFKGQAKGQGMQRLLSQLALAENELYLSRHGWKCRPRKSNQLGCDRRFIGAQEGFVGGNVSPAEPTTIRICTASSSPFTSWTTVLHEVMHRVKTSGEETYLDDPEYPGDNPLENADSYAHLVKELGAPDWSPCKKMPLNLRFFGGSNLGKGMVLGARLEFSPLGSGLRIVDWKAGVQFLWIPKFGVVEEAGDAPKTVLNRGYLGADTGVQINIPRKYGSLHFEAAAGLGLLWPGERGPAPAASATLSGRYRFGGKASGAEIGLDFGRLQSFTEKANGEWVVGLSVGYRFGRKSKRRR